MDFADGKQGNLHAGSPKRTKTAPAVFAVLLLVGLLPKPAGGRLRDLFEAAFRRLLCASACAT
jgi:hypothetical protein